MNQDQLREALDVLKAARPFVELEAGLANSGYGKPGRGDAPDVLARIDACLALGWPVPASRPHEDTLEWEAPHDWQAVG